MKYIEFKNRDKMPIVGLGTWKSEKGEVYNAVCEAIRMGYRHIDCAPIYDNEKEVGQAIKDCIADGLVKREELWITSKLWNSNHDRENVLPGLQKTLEDLNIKYLDLFLIHWPVSLKPGTAFPKSVNDFIAPEYMPIEETWKGMEEVLEQGLARHIGLSNFNVQKVENLLSNCNYMPEVNQVEMHPFLQQKKLVEFCNWHHIHLTAYSPLGSRDQKKLVKPVNEPDLFDEPAILGISENHRVTPAQILIAWSVMRNIAVIPKSVNKERLLQNLRAAEIMLTSDEMDRISELEKNYRYVSGKFWAAPGSPYSLEDLWGNINKIYYFFLLRIAGIFKNFSCNFILCSILIFVSSLIKTLKLLR